MPEALDKQSNEEFFSAYLYLQMSAYFDLIGSKGFATWMMVQYQEEMEYGIIPYLIHVFRRAIFLDRWDKNRIRFYS